MEKMRKPFQGVWNIVHFNWHFYVLALGLLLLIIIFLNSTTSPFDIYLSVLGFLVFLSTFISLTVSYYVYDFSGLYELNWIDSSNENKQIININAGFDETSLLLKNKFPNAQLTVFDFYDPEQHTEISIKRARKAYPLFPNTKSVMTNNLPFADNEADQIFLTFAAHEIRNEQERVTFFKELERILKPTGQIIVTEHLRDTTNFLAYNIGFFHFYSKQTWYKTFETVNFIIKKEQKLTPFISTFTLSKHGGTA
jgi:ubiquinone/menaquinone biosynthesis C-methylase UbiE